MRKTALTLTLVIALLITSFSCCFAAGANSAFGDKTRDTANELEGKIYYLSEGLEALPDFSKLKPLSGSIYADALNIEPRSFEDGFPGITDRFEWFGIVYSGKFGVKAGGEYVFALNSDDGSRLYIDGKLIVDNDGIHPPQQMEAGVVLKPGLHTIRVEYFQGPAYDIALQLFITPPGGETAIFSTKDYPAGN